MAIQQNVTMTLQRDDGSTLELDLVLTIARAEPDVGIMSDYVEEYFIEGDTQGVLYGELSSAEKDQLDKFIGECDLSE